MGQDTSRKDLDVSGPIDRLPPSPKSKGTGVPVGSATVVAAAALAILPQGGSWDELLKAPTSVLVALLLVFFASAVLFVGGVYVLIAERRGAKGAPAPSEPAGPIKAPKWGNVLAGVCWVGFFACGCQGHAWVQPSATPLSIAGVGFLAGALGGVPASLCITISSSLDLSAPRRVYGCVLTITVSCLASAALAALAFGPK
jgi:hypothetical protein